MDLKKAERQLEDILRSFEHLCNSSKDLISYGVDVTKIFSTNNDEETTKNDDGDYHMSAQEALAKLESLLKDIEDLQPKTDKIRKRMNEKDPITEAPRYGEKTMKRAILYCQRFDSLRYEFLKISGQCDVEDGNSSKDVIRLTDRLRQKVKEEEEIERKQRQEEIERRKSEEEKKKQSSEELQRQQLEIERQAQIERELQEEQLNLRAEMVRRQRQDAEARAIQTAIEADRAFVASVKKGPDGIRENLDKLKKSCAIDNDNSKEHIQAITALHTIFTQIVSHPEEIKFRRIRRDHPQFLKDIGKHDGGKEVLVAAGFKIEMVEGVSCLFTKEPDIEHDMDSWSKWYNLLKQTLEILEEELINSM